MGPIVGHKVKQAVDAGQPGFDPRTNVAIRIEGRESGEGAGASRQKVSDHHCAGGSAVAFPQLVPVSPVVGHEEERAVDIGQLDGISIAAAGVDVFDQHGADRGAEKSVNYYRDFQGLQIRWETFLQCPQVRWRMFHCVVIRRLPRYSSMS